MPLPPALQDIFGGVIVFSLHIPCKYHYKVVPLQTQTASVHLRLIAYHNISAPKGCSIARGSPFPLPKGGKNSPFVAFLLLALSVTLYNTLYYRHLGKCTIKIPKNFRFFIKIRALINRKAYKTNRILSKWSKLFLWLNSKWRLYKILILTTYL